MSDNEKDNADVGDSAKYTHEMKVVTAVWVHEKDLNNQTWKDINRNFLARFGLPPPSRSTFLNWERKLFDAGSLDDKEKSGRPLSRLMHVPYVRQSLQESPELSIRERSKLLGLPRTTLLKIIREDLNMEYEVEQDNNFINNPNKRHAPSGGGKWVKREKVSEETVISGGVSGEPLPTVATDVTEFQKYLLKFREGKAGDIRPVGGGGEESFEDEDDDSD